MTSSACGVQNWSFVLYFDNCNTSLLKFNAGWPIYAADHARICYNEPIGVPNATARSGHWYTLNLLEINYITVFKYL